MLPKVFNDKLTEVRGILIQHADDLEMSELWLFGSVARGDFNTTSDLDFIVITTGDSCIVSNKVGILEVRDDISYPSVDVIVRKESDLACYDVFASEVNKDKVILWKRGDLYATKVK